MRAISLLAACVAAQPPPPAGVCAFNGDGAATVTGVASIGLPGGNKGFVNVPAAIAATGSSTDRPAVFVLIAPKTGPSDALFGWAITQNATAQTLHAWTNDPAGAPTCVSDSVALPGYFVPGFSVCGGNVKAALWPAFQGGYSLGHAHVSEFASPMSNGKFT